MAQKVHILLVDDLDGSDAEETLTFGLDNATYEIDLNAANAAKMRDALSSYVGHARKVTSRRATRKAAAAPTGGPTPAAIREWGRANGFDLPDRGRVSAEVRQAYAAAH
jgi:hypothetical protein